jgi:hypothetical protein
MKFSSNLDFPLKKYCSYGIIPVLGKPEAKHSDFQVSQLKKYNQMDKSLKICYAERE